MDSFVDVTYRGIEVGKRAKLTEVAPDSGYVECAAPMPVGSSLVLAIGDGVTIAAEVRGVHEQVGGSDKPPGMRVAPKLEGAGAAWWAQRVTVAPAPPAAPRRTVELTAQETAAAHAVAERARIESGAPPIAARKTRIMAEGEIKAALSAAMAEEQKLGIAAGARTPVDGVPVQAADGVVGDDGLVDDGRKTEIMSSVDPDLIAKLTRPSGEHSVPVVDDGKRTIVMDTVVTDEDDDDADGDDDDDSGNGVIIEEQRPTPSGRMPAVKVKRGKKRKPTKR